MSFLNTIFLWGLPLIALPVVIHFFNRRRKKVIAWGAMRFLIAAATRRRRLWRLTDLLLLLLRIAAIALIIFALAQPLLKWGLFGGARSRDVIIVLDASMSTGRKPNGGEALFEKERKAAREVIGKLADRDWVRVMLAAGTPEWLAPSAHSASIKTKKELLELLDKAQPTPAGVDLLRCLTEAAGAEPADKRATRVITLITDGQAHGWRAETPALWQALPDRLQNLPGAAIVNVMRVDDGQPPAANLAITGLTATRTLAGIGDTIGLTATVQNTGARDSDPATLAWQRGDRNLTKSQLNALKPGEQTTVSTESTLDQLGAQTLSARIETSDELDLDNEEHLIVEVVEQVPILIVDGTPRNEALKTQSGYLLAALGQLPGQGQRRWQSVFKPRVIDALALEQEPLTDCHAVVLANIAQLSTAALERLADYVRRGGGLWITLGDAMDAATFNREIYMAGRGLSPLALTEVRGDADNHQQFIRVQPPVEYHPATRLLADTQRLDLDKVQVYRRNILGAPGPAATATAATAAASTTATRASAAEATTSVKAATAKAASASATPADLAILLKTDQNEPLLVEYPLGRGRVFIQSVPLDLSWTNLPACQSYVVMAQEWLWYLSEPSMTRWNLKMGEAFTALMPKSYNPQGTVTTPLGRKVEVRATEREGRKVFPFSRTLWPGDYELALTDGDGVAHASPFHVWRDPAESDLTPLTAEAETSLAAVGGFKFVIDPLADTVKELGGPSTEPFWARLLLALLAVLAFESLLSGLLNHARQSGTEAAAVE